jgi:hypothetical protein
MNAGGSKHDLARLGRLRGDEATAVEPLRSGHARRPQRRAVRRVAVSPGTMRASVHLPRCDARCILAPVRPRELWIRRRGAACSIALAGLPVAGCGVEHATMEAAVTAAVTRYASIGAQLCGHPTKGLAAATVRDLDASSLVQADMPGGHGRILQIGTGSAQIAGYDEEGRRCAGRLAFTYRALHGSKNHPSPWQVIQLGPVVAEPSGGGLGPERAPTVPSRTTGGVAIHELTLGPQAPTVDVSVALEARRPVTLYLHAVDDRDLPADFFALRVLRGEQAVFEEPRVSVTMLRVLVAPVTGVYTLRLSAAAERPVPTRLEIREGTPDAPAP